MSAPPAEARQRLGQLLRTLRLQESLTLADLGRRLSYDYTAISRFERAERPVPQQYIEDFCRELALPDEVRQALRDLYHNAEDAPTPAPPAPTRIGLHVAPRIATHALAALLGSAIALWLWRLGVYPAWGVREPGLGVELSWGFALGLGLGLGLGLFRVITSGQDRARTARGRLILTALSALGGAVGGLLWTGARPMLAGSPLPTLEETVLWGAIYAVGWVSPFVAAGLLWMPRADKASGKKRRSMAIAALVTILGTGALLFAAWVALYSVLSQVTQPLHDVVISLCLQACLAAGFAALSSALLPAIYAWPWTDPDTGRREPHP